MERLRRWLITCTVCRLVFMIQHAAVRNILAPRVVCTYWAGSGLVQRSCMHRDVRGHSHVVCDQLMRPTAVRCVCWLSWCAGTQARWVARAAAAVQQQAWRCCRQRPRQHVSTANQAANTSQQVRAQCGNCLSGLPSCPLELSACSGVLQLGPCKVARSLRERGCLRTAPGI